MWFDIIDCDDYMLCKQVTQNEELAWNSRTKEDELEELKTAIEVCEKMKVKLNSIIKNDYNSTGTL